MTQKSEAQKGNITPEMEAVAHDENINVNKLAKLIADGRVVIPKNINGHSKACGIGDGLKTKINANIGSSSKIDDIELEVNKAKLAQEYGADALMDLSTGSDLTTFRKKIMDAVDITIGTVPIYEAGVITLNKNKEIIDMDADDLFKAIENQAKEFGALSNYKNRNGRAPLSDSSRKDAYRAIEDKYGVKRDQSVPFYKTGNWEVPERYGRDGALVSVIRDSAGFLLVTPSSFGGEWWVPEKYVDRLGGADFRKLIFIDRTNQNLATLEQGDSTWLVRSMNPITTGLHRPPYKRETPPGVYVIRRKLEAMPFLRDGSIEPGGFAPWASRFSGGAYLHGVPVNYPDSVVLEYSGTLGTTPRSHMCVRNATSHAKFIYDWAPISEALVIVFD